ncbi:MAG: hypothetical protein GY822_10950 [Deltaproteobacteria bacterium]|nr:hypothetical protein [Deltaproteobacteria bacterium]
MTRLLIALCGFVGLLVPTWTLSKTPNVLAQGLIALISLGLLVGIWELFSRASKTQKLQDELHFLDETDGDVRKTLQKVDPLLAKLVRSLLAGRPAQVSSTTFAAYLITALAMVGLLGTFLGMVEALAGAREALSISREIDDLRMSLSGPLEGLSLAFGTSVAGVWSSSILGLAASILRRAEHRFVTELNAHFTAHFSAQTLAGRQLLALDRIGDQGDALPRAVTGLVEITDQLPELQRVLSEGQTETNAALVNAVVDAATTVRESLAASQKEMQKAQQKQMNDVMGQAGMTMQAHLEVWATAMKSTAARQDEQEEERLSRMQKTFQGVLDSYEEVLQRRAEDFAKGLADAATAQAEHQKSTIHDENERQNALVAQQEKQTKAYQSRDESIQQLLERAAELSERSTKETAAQGERMENLSQEVKEALTLQTDKSASLLDDLAEKVLQLAQNQEDHLEKLQAQSESGLRSLEEGAQAQLEGHLKTLGDAGSSRLQVVHVAQEQLGKDLSVLVEKLPNQLQEFQSGWVEDRRSHQELLDEKASQLMGKMLSHQQEQVSGIEEKAQHRVELFASSLDDKLQEVMTAQHETFAARQSEIENLTNMLSSSESARQKILDDVMEQAKVQSKMLSEQSTGFLSSLQEKQAAREQALLEQLQAQEETRRVEQAAQMQAWLETLQTQTEKRRDDDDEQRVEVLGGLIEEAKALAEASAAEKEGHRESILALQMRLDEERVLSAATLAEQLEAYSQKIAEQNKANEEVVGKAMTSLLTGSVDLAATAERFSDAVDAFRAAKGQLSLPMDNGPSNSNAASSNAISAVQNGSAAGPEEHFGGYLEHTKDLFDTSLQLQRALFEEIQALREGQA